MKSIIKFLLFFLAIVLVITWLVSIYKAGNNDIEPTDNQMNTEELMNDDEGSEEDVLEVMNEEELDEEYQTILEDTEMTEEELSDSQNNDEIAEEDYNEEDNISNEAETYQESLEEEPAIANDDYTDSNDDDIVQPYMVIVGSFLVPSNANNTKKKISDMGFDAEVVNFDLSQYHTVLAGRFDSYADAQSTVKDLKAKGVDAYAKKREK